MSGGDFQTRCTQYAGQVAALEAEVESLREQLEAERRARYRAVDQRISAEKRAEAAEAKLAEALTRAEAAEADSIEDLAKLAEVEKRVYDCPNAEVCKTCPCAGEDDVCFPGERLRVRLAEVEKELVAVYAQRRAEQEAALATMERHRWEIDTAIASRAEVEKERDELRVLRRAEQKRAEGSQVSMDRARELAEESVNFAGHRTKDGHLDDLREIVRLLSGDENG